MYLGFVTGRQNSFIYSPDILAGNMTQLYSNMPFLGTDFVYCTGKFLLLKRCRRFDWSKISISRHSGKITKVIRCFGTHQQQQLLLLQSAKFISGSKINYMSRKYQHVLYRTWCWRNFISGTIVYRICPRAYKNSRYLMRIGMHQYKENITYILTIYDSYLITLIIIKI